MRLFTMTAIALLMSGGAAIAETGVGPVYQSLQQQGFTHMQTYREQSRLRVTAERGDQLRQLVYDANTGKLLWDSMSPDRDQTQDRIYLKTQDQLRLLDKDQTADMDRDQDRDKDTLGDTDQDRTKDQDRTQDPATHT